MTFCSLILMSLIYWHFLKKLAYVSAGQLANKNINPNISSCFLRLSLLRLYSDHIGLALLIDLITVQVSLHTRGWTGFLRTKGMLTAKTCRDSLLYLPAWCMSSSRQHFWRRDFDKEYIQRRGTSVVRGSESMPSEERLRQLDMVSAVKKGHGFCWEKLKGSQVENLISMFCITLKG